MTTITCRCPACGSVEVRNLRKVAIAVDRQSYEFTCPRCLRLVVKRADDHIVSLLLTAGVGFIPPPMPALPEVRPQPSPHPERVPSHAPSLTEDDLIDFGLNFDAELAALLRSA